RSVHRAVRLQPIGLIVGPTLEEGEVLLDGVRRARAHRKTLLGIFDTPRRDLLEAHGAPLLQHGQRRMKRAGHDGGIETLAVQILVARIVPVDGGALRGPALADNSDDLAGAARIDEDESFAAQAVEIL